MSVGGETRKHLHNRSNLHGAGVTEAQARSP